MKRIRIVIFESHFLLMVSDNNLRGKLEHWTSTWGNPFRSLKRHGSSPECVLDLLCFLKESSDEKMQQMDLDDVTVEQVAAARSALREVIGHVELVLKKGEERWWDWNLRLLSWWLGYEALADLQAMEARASVLMTRLEEEAEKEHHTMCLQEVALNSIGIFVF